MTRRPLPSRSTAPFRALPVVLALFAGACGLSNQVEDTFQSPSGGSGSGAAGTGGSGTAGSGATGTGGSGGGVGAGGSGTAGSGASGPEDCLDGADGDGDGLVDCADPDCNAGFECAPAAPAGWDGYYRVRRLPIGDPTPACAGGEAPEALLAGPAGPAECTACSCGPLEQAACAPPQILCWPGSGSCQGSNPADWTMQLADGTCQKPNLPIGTFFLSCALGGPAAVLEEGACAPSAVDFPNKDTWADQVTACGAGPAGGGCGGADVCVPRVDDPAESLCVRQSGAGAACPAGWTEAVQAFTGGADTRGCSSCSCGSPGTTCAGGGYTVFDFNDCANGGDAPVAVDSNQCDNVSGLLDSLSWSVQAQLPTPSGACPAAGGEPTGAVQTEGPVTFCCR